MSRGKHYTQQELEEIKLLRKQGATYPQIAEMFGRTPKAIAVLFQSKTMTESVGGIAKKPEPQPDSEIDNLKAQNKSLYAEIESLRKQLAEARKRSLETISPRDIIKHLYNLGYRIEDGELVVIEKKVVNIKSVLHE